MGLILKGYQIYYRVFDTQTAADASRTAIETAISSSTATPESSLASLQSAGYVTIAAADGGLGPSGTSPLFMVSSSELGNLVTYTIYLNEQGANSSAYISTYVWDGTTGAISVNDFSQTSTSYAYWYFNRTFPQATPSPSTFSPQLVNIAINRTQGPTLSSHNNPVSFETGGYSSGDPDYAGAGAGSGNTIWFVFFALAYGVDTSSASFGNLYSQPMSLYISIPYKIP